MIQKFFLVWFHLVEVNRQKCEMTSSLQIVELDVYYRLSLLGSTGNILECQE